MNKRQQELARILCGTNENAPLTVDKLAELTQASPRTIRYDLDALAGELAEQGLRLRRQSRRGTWVERMDIAEPHVAFVDVPYIPDKNERCDYVMVALADGQAKSIDALASELAVSRNTLLMDLKEVQTKLTRRGLTYMSKRGVGIWAEGDEQNVRDALIHVLARTSYDFRKYGEMQLMSFQDRLLAWYVGELPVRELADLLLTHLTDDVHFGSDTAVNRMVCALIVQVKRLNQGHRLPQESNEPFATGEGDALLTLAQKLGQGMKAFAPEVTGHQEMDYIVRELLHSRIYFRPDKQLERVQSMELALQFVSYVQNWMGDVYTDDEELIYNVAMHLQPALERARFGIRLTNPLLGDIKEQYGGLYEIVRRAADKLSANVGLQLSADEVGYLTMHIGGAVERHGIQRVKMLSVLLVCGNGVGTANLLAMTLQHRLTYIRISKIVSRYTMTQQDLEAADVVISTIDLQAEGKAVLRVSPILQDAEINIIKKQLQYLYSKKFPPESCLEGKPNTLGRGLSELLTEDMIALDVEAADWENAIRTAGGLLRSAGAVTENYVDRMVSGVRELGPYIVVCPGIALPHARIEDGAKRVAVSFLRLRNPVMVMDRIDSEADMFFAFSTIDDKVHLNLMADLWELFNDADTLAALRACQSPRDVVRLIQRYQ